MANEETNLAAMTLEIISAGGFGAFAAFCFNKLHWWQTEKERKNELTISTLYNNLIEIERTAIKYWLSSDSSRSPENLQMELLIKSLLTTQRKLLAKLTNRSKSIQSIKKLEDLHKRIYETATGGDFETRARKASPSKSNTISRLTADMQLSLIDLITS